MLLLLTTWCCYQLKAFLLTPTLVLVCLCPNIVVFFQSYASFMMLLSNLSSLLSCYSAEYQCFSCQNLRAYSLENKFDRADISPPPLQLSDGTREYEVEKLCVTVSITKQPNIWLNGPAIPPTKILGNPNLTSPMPWMPFLNIVPETWTPRFQEGSDVMLPLRPPIRVCVTVTFFFEDHSRMINIWQGHTIPPLSDAWHAVIIPLFLADSYSLISAVVNVSGQIRICC